MNITSLILLVFLLCVHSAGGIELGDPPAAPSREMIRQWQQMPPVVLETVGGYSVAITNREAVRAFYNTVFQASENAIIGWTGDAATCTAGTTRPAFRNEVARRINFYRAMAGLPANIALSPANNVKCQQAALMMSVNSTLSHAPSDGWTCYTPEGAEAAQNSNLALGRVGPDAINGYMMDHGANNTTVGHRRWMLYPQTQTMGTGDIPANGSYFSANTTWGYDSNYFDPRPTTRDGFVSWPPPGYVPYQLVWPRWSFGLPDANFSTATVTLSINGISIPITLELTITGPGENTLVWHPSHLDPAGRTSWPPPASDTTYNVCISNVLIDSTNCAFNYSVTIFDPAKPGADTVLPAISGSATPPVNQSTPYEFVPVPIATDYQWRQSQCNPFTEVEGAENGTHYFTTDVSPGYSIVTTAAVVSGTAAFHLAHPSPTDQIMTYKRVLVPGTNSQMNFQSQLGVATTTQVATVQVSLDEGNTWNDVYSQAGAGTNRKTAYTLRTISLANYAGRSLHMRLRYALTGSESYPQTDYYVGWLIDDISFTDTEELTSMALSDVTSDTSFHFMPALLTNYALQVRAHLDTDFYLEWGPIKRVTAVPQGLLFCGPPEPTNTSIVLRWNSSPNHLYTVHYSTNLVAGFTVLQSNILATPVINSYTDSVLSDPKMFWKITSDQ